MDPMANPGDPFNNCYFSLEIEGTEVAHFRECTGFKSVAEVYLIQEGGYNGAVHKRPGRSKWAPVTLKCATSASTELMAWRDEFITDQFTSRPTKSGAIVIRGEDGGEVRRYSFTGCWPISWEGPKLNGNKKSEMAIESVEISFDTLTVGASGSSGSGVQAGGSVGLGGFSLEVDVSAGGVSVEASASGSVGGEVSLDADIEFA
jgi:phage tail-like protein